jgi:ketosteroid isomerase-like protein
MKANTPQQINDLFVKYMREGDLDAALTLYEPGAALESRDGTAKTGTPALREELAAFAQRRQVFEFDIKKVIQAGDVALVHNVAGHLTTRTVRVCTGGSAAPAGRQLALADR